MPRDFWRATAEAVVAAVDATYVGRVPIDGAYVSSFAQLTVEQASAALELAVDLNLLKKIGAEYRVASPLCRALATANLQRKATALRVALENYEPFALFRDRLTATGNASTAARQVKQLLDLSTHHEEVKETLLSLGQYSQALVARGGGEYDSRADVDEYDLTVLAKGCDSDVAAEQLIRRQLGERAEGLVSRDDVVVPLATALLRARASDGRGAVVSAGNAVESFLLGLGDRSAVDLTTKTGINAKAEELATHGALPKKLLNVGKYLGHVRNAADHGIDPDVGTGWVIRNSTGLEYVFVTCSFIAAVCSREQHGPCEI